MEEDQKDSTNENQNYRSNYNSENLQQTPSVNWKCLSCGFEFVTVHLNFSSRIGLNCPQCFSHEVVQN